MKLQDLLAQAGLVSPVSKEVAPILVAGLETDSRRVEKDFIFVAIQGAKEDGSRFIGQAIERGAIAVVADKEVSLPPGICLVLVPDARLAAARLAAVFYGGSAGALGVIGITGTNGKTTSSYILEHLLNLQKRQTGIIGTVSYRFAGKEVPASETTPGPIKLQKILSQMQKEGCEYVAMEVSSHALDQHRVAGIDFCVAVFTNLTQDHLDYHGTLEAYFEAKAKLFSGLSPKSIAVVNTDDEWGKKLLPRTRARVVRYGVNPDSDLRAENIRFEADSTEWDLLLAGKKIKVSSPLVGLHNVYNVLGALGVLYGLGFSIEKAVLDLQSFRGVPGRLEAVSEGQAFKVYIDFAHTPDGLLNVLKALQDYRKNKLLVVFGCGGDRDRSKRPQMGKIASKLADFVYVTSDNPRSENPRAIADEICAGFESDFKNYTVVLDRRKAIRQALMAAREGDLVLLAGKGHEKTQIIRGEILPFSDLDEARKVLQGR